MNSVPHVTPPPEPASPPREPALRIPPVTGWLIAINVLIQLARAPLPQGLDDRLVELLGFAPTLLAHQPAWLTILSLFTYQFLHGGWEHLAINMASLLAFGSGIERPLGPARYLILYLVGGIAGALLETVVSSVGGDGVLIGASASISAVFGALLIVRAIYGGGRGRFAFVPMALVWIVLMSVTGIAGVGSDGEPVAWIAHIGGFVTGIGFGLLYRPSIPIR